MDSWLQELAFHNQANDFARTFVVTDREKKVRAFYALCAGMILRKDAPRRAAPHGTPSEIPIALLARLAVARDLQGRGLGRTLLSHALRNVASASQTVAFRAVIVDAIDDEALAFYKRFGFAATKISPTKLILPTQDILAALRAAKES